MNRIRQLRQEHGLRQRDLAERTGIHQSTLCRMEHPSVSPRVSFLRKIATALNVTVDDLISERVA